MSDKKKGGAKAPEPASMKSAPASSSKPANKPAESKNAGKRKPDEAQHDKDMKAITDKIAELQTKSDNLRSRIDNADSNSPGGAKRKALLEERKKFADETRAIREQKDRMLKQYEESKKVRDAKVREAEEIRDKAGPHKSSEKIDQTIAEMETKIRSGTLKLIDEKKYVTEISNLKKGKKNLEVYDKRMEELEADKKALDELKAKLDAKFEETKSISDKLAQFDVQLDDLKKNQDADKAKITQLIEERNITRQQIEELYEKKRTLYASFKQQRDEYRVHQQEEQVKRKEAYRLQREQNLEEKKKALEERRKEERMIPKFVEEITSATNIINFLQATYVNEKQAENVVEEKKAVEAAEGMVALKTKAERNDEDIYYAGKAAKKEKKPAAPKVVKKTDSLKFSIAMLDQFSSLGVAIPSTVGEVEGTIKALQDRKAHFEAKQKAALEQAAKEVEEELKATANGSGADLSSNSAEGSGLAEKEISAEAELEDGEIAE